MFNFFLFSLFCRGRYDTAQEYALQNTLRLFQTDENDEMTTMQNERIMRKRVIMMKPRTENEERRENDGKLW